MAQSAPANAVSTINPDTVAVVDEATQQPVADDTEESKLAAHLARLQGIDKHTLDVLERYLAPLHEAQLAEARQAVEARESQLQLMRERISAQVATIVSDDEEQLFYNRDDAFRAYIQRGAGRSPPAPYGPPVPEPSASLYVEPGHLALYRVGYMAFIPLRPRRSEHSDTLLKLKIPRAALPGVKPSQREEGQRDALTPVSDNVPLPSAVRLSLFRRKEELRPGNWSHNRQIIYII